MIKTFAEGDIVEILLPSGKMVVGWIVYISKYFKDVIGIVACDDEEMDVNHVNTASLRGTPIYTNIAAAQHYGWIVVGHKEVRNLVDQVTTRVVGGEVFAADKCVRVATDEDRKILPKMLVKGMPLVYDELEQISTSCKKVIAFPERDVRRASE